MSSCFVIVEILCFGWYSAWTLVLRVASYGDSVVSDSGETTAVLKIKTHLIEGKSVVTHRAEWFLGSVTLHGVNKEAEVNRHPRLILRKM